MTSPKALATVMAVLLAPQLASAQNNASFQASSVASTNASSAQSADASQVSSTGTLIVLGAGLLAGVGGGITTTMYRRDERAKRLAQPPAPAPPTPLEPVPYPGPTPEPTPPPPPPPLSKLTPEGEPTLDAMVEARWWLLANEVQLKQDLALGAGPALDDLAGLARIAPARRAHFFKLLQKNRAVLLTPRDVTPREAALMMSRVGELVLADPILRADGQAALAAL